MSIAHAVCHRPIDDHIVTPEGLLLGPCPEEPTIAFAAAGAGPYAVDGLATRPLPLATCPGCLAAYPVDWFVEFGGMRPVNEGGQAIEGHVLAPLGAAVLYVDEDNVHHRTMPAILSCMARGD
jgi:hypothetical protein